jgi:hypothetical protein
VTSKNQVALFLFMLYTKSQYVVADYRTTRAVAAYSGGILLQLQRANKTKVERMFSQI